MNKFKYYAYKILIFVLLRLPDGFFALLLKFAFPIYRILHTKRAYGRVDRLLRETGFWGRKAMRRPRISPRDVFESLYWNGIDSYRHQHSPGCLRKHAPHPLQLQPARAPGDQRL